MTRSRSQHFPFSAIVGQETLKIALLINAIDPRVGGVLIRGEKGTAKSTAVRALHAVLPEIRVTAGCPYGCDPSPDSTRCEGCDSQSDQSAITRRPNLVELPVSATEDRLVGTMDLEHALKHGERRYEPGLLARANRGILYVDEVNLLDDHLVDTLLDVAASGVNVVEREGIAFAHPARFILIGTMNPEEGDVRPQLLDRFGLCVDVRGLSEPDARVDVVRRRRAFEDDPEAFIRTWSVHDEALASRIAEAHRALPDIELDDELLFLVASLCSAMGVDGHRADLVLGRAACAHALLEGRREVTAADVRVIAPLVLAHRMRRTPFGDQQFDEGRLSEAFDRSAAPADGATASESSAPGGALGTEAPPTQSAPGEVHTTARADDAAVRLAADMDRIRRSQAGRRQTTRTDDGSGRYVRSEQPRAGDRPDVALDATIRAAAPHQAGRVGDMAIRIQPDDMRNKVRTRKVGASIVFCVDASGSMGAASRMEAARAAIYELLVDAYQRRDRVGLVAFRGETAEIVLQPTASVELAHLKLKSIPTGGATPLAHGILASVDVLGAEVRRDSDVVPWLVLVTDGKANIGLGGGLGSEDARSAAARLKDARIHTLVIDAGTLGSGLAARELARHAGGSYIRLSAMNGAEIAGTVRNRVAAG
jgi:magnesium chelatase subunit D